MKDKATDLSYIGNYQILSTIGSGSMGIVKLGVDMRSGNQVAIKILKQHIPTSDYLETIHPNQLPCLRSGWRPLSKQETDDQRSMRELSFGFLMHHPNIVSLHEVILSDGHYYMIYDYVKGSPLLDFIVNHGRLKEKYARRFFRQLVSCIEYIHSHSIVHRDLKIENVLIDKQGILHLIDFGLANVYAPDSLLATFCGSLYFAAPELLSAKRYIGPEVDIWSLGVILFVLVCGKVPFDDSDLSKLHKKIKKGKITYPSYLSAPCLDLLSRILVVDPTQRITLQQLKQHPWIMEGYSSPPSSYIPSGRIPLSLPLDKRVLEGMQGLEMGTVESMEAHLTRILQGKPPIKLVGEHERKSAILRSGIVTGPRSPLESIYHLVKERYERLGILEPQPMPELISEPMDRLRASTDSDYKSLRKSLSRRRSGNNVSNFNTLVKRSRQSESDKRYSFDEEGFEYHEESKGGKRNSSMQSRHSHQENGSESTITSSSSKSPSTFLKPSSVMKWFAGLGSMSVKKDPDLPDSLEKKKSFKATAKRPDDNQSAPSVESRKSVSSRRSFMLFRKSRDSKSSIGRKSMSSSGMDKTVLDDGPVQHVPRGHYTSNSRTVVQVDYVQAKAYKDASPPLPPPPITVASASIPTPKLLSESSPSSSPVVSSLTSQIKQQEQDIKSVTTPKSSSRKSHHSSRSDPHGTLAPKKGKIYDDVQKLGITSFFNVATTSSKPPKEIAYRIRFVLKAMYKELNAEIPKSFTFDEDRGIIRVHFYPNNDSTRYSFDENGSSDGFVSDGSKKSKKSLLESIPVFPSLYRKKTGQAYDSGHPIFDSKTTQRRVAEYKQEQQLKDQDMLQTSTGYATTFSRTLKKKVASRKGAGALEFHIKLVTLNWLRLNGVQFVFDYGNAWEYKHLTKNILKRLCL